MTVQEAVSHLIEHFTSNDSFDIKKDLPSLAVVCSSKEEKKEIFSLALLELEQENILRKGEEKWYLLKPFDAVTQQVPISPRTSIEISNIINSFCESLEDFKDYCDPLEISEKDIFNLTLIVKHLKNLLES